MTHLFGKKSEDSPLAYLSTPTQPWGGGVLTSQAWFAITTHPLVLSSAFEACTGKDSIMESFVCDVRILRSTYLHPTHTHTVADFQIRYISNKTSYFLDYPYAFMTETLIRMFVMLVRLRMLAKSSARTRNYTSL